MDTNTLIIIVVVVLLLGGGGFFYRGRRVAQPLRGPARRSPDAVASHRRARFPLLATGQRQAPPRAVDREQWRAPAEQHGILNQADLVDETAGEQRLRRGGAGEQGDRARRLGLQAGHVIGRDGVRVRPPRPLRAVREHVLRQGVHQAGLLDQVRRGVLGVRRRRPVSGQQRMGLAPEDHAVDRLQRRGPERIDRRIAGHPLDVSVPVLDEPVERDVDLQKQFGHIELNLPGGRAGRQALRLCRHVRRRSEGALPLTSFDGINLLRIARYRHAAYGSISRLR